MHGTFARTSSVAKMADFFENRYMNFVCSITVTALMASLPPPLYAFLQRTNHPEADVSYKGLLHRPGNLFDLEMFDGDENAIVDFKYAASERLTWWFDHHQSAFSYP